jgi:hypothetical protein
LKLLPRHKLLSIKQCPVPANTLLAKYLMGGTYTDCYSTEIPGQISLPEFVFAFYTTPLFKLERLILRWTVAKPSTDTQARRLADQSADRFAAWQVEARSENEILMCDFLGRTRSWLMVTPLNTGNDSGTRLYFGSAVVPKRGKSSLEFRFRTLLRFHQIYSISLLYFAKSRLMNLRRDHEQQKSHVQVDG